MTDYPESGVKLVIDTASAQTAISDIQSQLDDLQSATYTATVTAEADTSGLDSDLADLPLDGETVSFTVEADVEGDLADLPVDGETIDTTVAVETDDTSEKTLTAMQTLANLKVVETVWNIAGTAVDLFKDLGGKALDPILKLGDAVAEVGAKTGGAIPNADKLINQIFYDDLGKSKEEVGKLIIAAHGLSLPVDEATRAALTFTHTWSDVDSVQAITTFGTLLNTNLVGNMQEASDLMTVFFQEGGNKGGDALQVVNTNAESWANMGLTAQQALSTISTLLKGNVDNAGDAAKMIQTLDDNLTTAASNADSPQAKMLGTMGLENPKDKGQAMGADFIDGFAEAFANLPADQQDLASGLFMGKGGKKFTGAIEGMTANSDMFKNVTDAAKIAATEIDNSLKGAINDFVLKANQKMEEFLSSDVIDIPGKINKLKEGLQSGMDVLAKGGTLSDALTVALKPLGFDDEFQGLESALGNFIIALLQVVSSIQSLSPSNWAAKAGTDAAIAQQGAAQLAFDLKIANPDDLAATVATAVSRGVTPATITDTISGAIDQLVQEGSIKQAQALLDEFKKNAPNLQPAQGLNGEQLSVAEVALRDGGDKLQDAIDKGIVVNVTPSLTPEAQTALQAQIDAATNAAADSFLVQQQNAVINATTTVKPGVDALQASATKTLGPVQQQATATGVVGDKAKAATTQLDAQSNATYTVVASASAAVNPLMDMSTAIDKIRTSADGLKVSAAHVADVQGTLPKDTPTAHAAGGDFTGTSWVGEDGPELVHSDKGLSVWNNATSNAFLQALQSFVPGSVGGGGGQVNNTIVNYNQIPNVAVGDALGFKQAQTLRGMQGN